jgi:hypothetical protein
VRSMGWAGFTGRKAVYYERRIGWIWNTSVFISMPPVLYIYAPARVVIGLRDYPPQTLIFSWTSPKSSKTQVLGSLLTLDC